MAFRVWNGVTNDGTTAIIQETLAPERVAQICRRLPDIQTWTNEAATGLLPVRSSMSPAEWGTAVHSAIHKRIKALKEGFPAAFADVFSELTVDGSGLDNEDPDGPRYGGAGTSRLGVVEKVSGDTYCVVDVKTGTSGLTEKRVLEILKKLPVGIVVYIMEVRPFE